MRRHAFNNESQTEPAELGGETCKPSEKDTWMDIAYVSMKGSIPLVSFCIKIAAQQKPHYGSRFPKTNSFLRAIPIMYLPRVGFVQSTQIFTRADPQLRVARRRRCIASESRKRLWNLRWVRDRSISGT